MASEGDILEIPDELAERRDAYCTSRGKTIFARRRGFGFDAVIWQTDDDNILKVFRRPQRFHQELAVYQRLQALHSKKTTDSEDIFPKQLYRIQGFSIPLLLDFDEPTIVLELSYVSPPYILDFAEASLEPRQVPFDDPTREVEYRRVFGANWPEVRRLLDSLRQLGIFYMDVHGKNICC